MASADNPNPDLTPIPPLEMTPELDAAITDVLLAAPMLASALAPDHLPFTATLAEAVDRYGATPLLGLWAACKALQRLKEAVRG